MSNGDPGSILGARRLFSYKCIIVKEVKDMKKLAKVFFWLGAIIIYGLVIGAFFIGNESEVLFLMLGFLGGIYIALYLALKYL